MARGLSSQQVLLLIIAYRKRILIGEHFPEMGRLLYYSEIFNFLYEWPVKSGADRINYGLHNYDQATIGHNKYNSIRAVISKAARRLEKRELARRCKNGIEITESGVAYLQDNHINIGLRLNIKEIISRYQHKEK